MEWRRPVSLVKVKAKQTHFQPMLIATVLWDTRGILLVDWMPRGRTINVTAHCATPTILRRAIQNKHKGMLTKGILLQESARPHIAGQSQDLVDSFRWDVIGHPPYSRDLSPSDFYLIYLWNTNLAGGALTMTKMSKRRWQRGCQSRRLNSMKRVIKTYEVTRYIQ